MPPARLVQVTIRNRSQRNLRWRDDHREHGFWQDPWYPSNLKVIRPGHEGTFRQESGGILTGVAGEVAFTVDNIPATVNTADDPDPAEELTFGWRLPYIGPPTIPAYPPVVKRHYHPGTPPLTWAVTTSVSNVYGQSFFSEAAGALAVGVVWIPFAFFALLSAEHIFLTIELRDGSTSTVSQGLTPQALTPEALRASGPVVIYAVQDNGDLLWYRHEDRDDGADRWAPGSGTKVGNGWHFKQVFSGGDGVIYAIQDTTVDVSTGRRIGGNLAWYRHDGWRTGGAEWTSPVAAGKKWDKFKQVFYGGDGVIYAIQDNGDLLWYRHEGRDDGADRWAPGSGKKVGNGWHFKQVFSGGDGVIYAIQDTTVDVSTGRRIGGNLAWYRHDGWRTGGAEWTSPVAAGKEWDKFKQVFYGGDGVIYAIQDTTIDMTTGQRTGGHLLWYRHDGQADGSSEWAEGSGKAVGKRWNYHEVFSG